MPRKPLRITHEFPYHIVARSNNKDWFYIPIDECWMIFTDALVQACLKFHLQIHAFVLMKNHYHLIATTSEEFPLPRVMEWFQRTVNRRINDKAGRINHLFGGPYKATLIQSEVYYLHAIKYLYRNPVDAKIVQRVEEYDYSSLVNSKLPLVTPITGITSLITKISNNFIYELNIPYTENAMREIKIGMQKREFVFSSRIENALKKELRLRI